MKQASVGGVVQVLDVAFRGAGLTRVNPFSCTLEQLAENESVYQRLLYEACGDLGMGNPDLRPELFVPQHDPRLVVAMAYGVPSPKWDASAGTWWFDPAHNAWDGVRGAGDVDDIRVPEWGACPLVQEMADKWREYREKAGEEKASQVPLGSSYAWTDPGSGQAFRFSHFMSFLDMGQTLMGATRFFEVLAGNPELSDAMLRKTYEISSSYAHFMDRMYDRRRTGFMSLGGDNSCVLSPEMFRRYGMGFDRLVMAECPGLPCNLHSCGPSKHLYGVWAEYPHREKIVLMQTRAVPGAMKPLRAALPHTHVQLTVHQPQVEFERESPDRVQALVWELAEAMDFRAATIVVLVSWVDDRVKENIRAFRAALEAVKRRVALDA